MDKNNEFIISFDSFILVLFISSLFYLDKENDGKLLIKLVF